MKTILRSLTTLFSMMIVAAAMGCDTAPGNANRGTNTNTTANTNTANANTAPAPNNGNAKASNFTMTLPLLDALFAEETFASDLKSKLQLTDDEVNRLRSTAREATARLRESNDADSHQGTTAAARKEAADKINAAIGAEKARALSAFVSERYSGEASASTVPSAAPSDTRIVVNAPAFRMDVFDSGRLIKSYKVAIGYPEFPLPTGMRKADTIIFNPTWTPPDEPWVESPGSKVKVGETVKGGDKLNPLGPLKIPIGLPSLIHGGKTPAKLGNFGSHGCVGLTNPQAQEFAKLLAQVSGTGLDDAQIAEYEKNKTKPKSVKLPKPVPVELRYDTIVVEDGKLHIYRDVYDHDTNTEENLRSALQANGVTLEQLSDQERSQALNALKEMSRDPSGKLDEESNGKNANANSNASAKSKNGNASGKVTRVIKGSKEAVIEIAALKGKGYPAPVDMSGGSAQDETARQPARGKKKKQ